MKQTPGIECVAFDLDGVVIPSGPSFNYFSSQFNITAINFMDFFRGPYQDCLIGKTDLFDVLPAALQEWGWKKTVEDFAYEWMNSCSDPEPDAVTLINVLLSAGVKCCAASNQDNRRAAFLDNLPWLKALFKKRFFSCNMGSAKPDIHYFRFIEDNFGASPETTLFVDDKKENVEAARMCGWHAELCRGATELHAILAFYCPDIVSPTVI
jgi:putative hydrolase of the HAD superfamily